MTAKGIDMFRAGRPILAVGPIFANDQEFRQARHALENEGMQLFAAPSQDAAALWLCEIDPSVVLIALDLTDGSPLAVADFCHYRRPDTRIILLGGGVMGADGSLFSLVGNAAAIMPSRLGGGDLTALIAHHADAKSTTPAETA